MKSRLTYLLCVIGAFIFYLFYNGYLSFMFFLFVFIVPIISFILTLLGYFKTTLQLENEFSTIQQHQQSQVTLTRQSTTFPVGKIDFDLKTNQPLNNEILSEHYQFEEDMIYIVITGHHCGKINISVNNVRFYDYFNLLRLRKKNKSQLSIIVLPVVQDVHLIIEKMALFEQQSTLYDPYHPGDDYSELFEVRNYRDGDPINRIHWKLTNKYQTLMIKEGSNPLDKNAVLTFKLTYHAEKNDQILSLFHSLAIQLCKQEIAFDIAYKIMRKVDIQIISITSTEQYEQVILELLGQNLEKNYSLTNHELLKEYQFHYHINELGIIENNELLGGDQ